MIPAFPDTAFWQAYQGSFSGLMQWQQVTEFFDALAENADNWFVFQIDAPLPEAPLTAAEFKTRLTEMRNLTLAYRDASHCFSLFTDNVTDPQFVKVFDPGNLGASCGSSGSRTYPRWTLSRIKPDAPAPVANAPVKAGFFGKIGKRFSA